ncbi:NAD(P)/FAD-dependent oxidoreductase [Phycicoccus avicenniae]|uniref:NAD(P)/FAD-dependent oxidoreductase n=1 Tax=Phycicoccus avicenniae TaxID=2828860 RepID=UPI003D276A9C
MTNPALPGPAVVVGAGVVGCSIALSLSRQGYAVTVVDRGPQPGSATTSSSSAVVRFHYTHRTAVALALESALMWKDWSGVVGPVGDLARFYEVGALVYDSPLLRLDTLERLFDEVGVVWQRWDPQASRAAVPALDPGHFGPPVPVDTDEFFADADGELACLFTPQGGFIDDPQLATANLADAARAAGAGFVFRDSVVAVPGTGPVECVELESGRSLPAEVVVNAAGPWSARMCEIAGVLDEITVPTRPLRQEVHVIEAPDGFAVGHGGVCVTDADLGTYFRPHPGGTLLVGGLEPACDPLEWIEDLEDYPTTVTRIGYERNVHRMARRLPDAAVPPRPVGLASAYDVTPDWVPVYDKTSRAGFFLAIGTSGNQFKNAPMIGAVIAALVDAERNGRDHDVDPVRLALPRLGLDVDLGYYSRRRTPHAGTGSVVG